MVILENSIHCFARTMNNGIYVPTYYGETDDKELSKIIELLKEVANCESIPKELEERLGLAELYKKYLRSLKSRII